MEPIRVVIVEGRTLLRQSLVALLRSEPDCEPLGDAADLEAAARLCHRALPDWILLDATLLERDATDALAQLRAWAEQAALLALGWANDAEAAQEEEHRMKQAGADAYLPLFADRLALLHLLRHARPAPHLSEPPLHLSEREREALALLAEGLSNKEIAARLNIRAQTVKNHISHLLEKLAFEDRTQLAVYYMTHLAPKAP